MTYLLNSTAMKILKLLFLFLLAQCSLFAQNPTTMPDPNAPELMFEMEQIDYGRIMQYADGNREFHFKNVGKQPLIISAVKASSGCTATDWPHDPVKPGASGTIRVRFDTGTVGYFQKSFAVISNSSHPTITLEIKGHVESKDRTHKRNPTVQKSKE